MGGFLEPTPTTEERSSIARPVMLGVGLVIVVVGIIAFFTRSEPKVVTGPPPYAANIALTDLKMSAAENFVGASVTYLDGTVANTGDKTVTHAMLHLGFKNSLGEVAQSEDLPLRILQTSGPYPDAVDLTMAPLGPGQSKSFRLILEHVSADWNREYPIMQITDVTLK